ncbi:hypothetical protein ACKQC9_31110, partial [Klebsiella michiganensis]|uniref:hypothetical protein n=1 Tax=Klebsiella michiganensis TaxID=1134687 RepID=UPI003D6DAF2D
GTDDRIKYAVLIKLTHQNFIKKSIYRKSRISLAEPTGGVCTQWITSCFEAARERQIRRERI